MAPPTDLTWLEFNQALKKTPDDGNYIFIFQPGDSFADRKLLLDLSSLLDLKEPLDLGNPGVVKAFSMLLKAARNAQEKLNQGRPVGDRLAAFPPPTVGNQANGFVPVTRAVASRAELNSATGIIGAVI